LNAESGELLWIESNLKRMREFPSMQHATESPVFASPLVAARPGMAEIPPELFEYDSQLALPCMEVLQAIGWPDRKSSGGLRTVGVTSSHRGEGVSTVAAHLAATAASYGQGPVLLVDCNLVRPAAHALLGVSLSPGLSACLRGVEGALAAIRRSPIPGLSVLPAGDLHGSPARLYGAAALGELIQRAAERFELTVFDLPSASQASCLAQLAGRLDGVVLVIEVGRVTREVARSAKERLESAGARLVGSVLNHRSRRRDKAS
jgi:Mrp family chromosome partitioning ATPase